MKLTTKILFILLLLNCQLTFGQIDTSDLTLPPGSLRIHPSDFSIIDSLIEPNSIRIQVRSNGFEKFKKQSIIIDSLFRNSDRLDDLSIIDSNNDGLTLDLKNLELGSYLLYGRTVGSTGEARTTMFFNHKFEIKTGGNNK